MEVCDLSKGNFFCPRSVAVIGASRGKGKVGNVILENIINSGYSGKIYPVNPNADEIFGIKCYPSILDTPTDVELVIITIPAQFVCRL